MTNVTSASVHADDTLKQRRGFFSTLFVMLGKRKRVFQQSAMGLVAFPVFLLCEHYMYTFIAWVGANRHRNNDEGDLITFHAAASIFAFYILGFLWVNLVPYLQKLYFEYKTTRDGEADE